MIKKKTIQSVFKSSAVHSPIIAGAKFKGTPAYTFSLNRLLTLGLSGKDAKELLKG